MTAGMVAESCVRLVCRGAGHLFSDLGDRLTQGSSKLFAQESSRHFQLATVCKAEFTFGLLALQGLVDFGITLRAAGLKLLFIGVCASLPRRPHRAMPGAYMIENLLGARGCNRGSDGICEIWFANPDGEGIAFEVDFGETRATVA